MSRVARLILPGAAYHITARGNYRQAVFFNEDDFAIYLQVLGRRSLEGGLELLGWCLMPNHVHVLAKEVEDGAMAATLKRVQSEYSCRINRRQCRTSGHLWQSRFYSAPVQEERMWSVLRYIELNPVRAGICASPVEYCWSTARYHVVQEQAPEALSMRAWRSVWTADQWRSVLNLPADCEQDQDIRKATARGLPLGGAEFLSKCEIASGRSLVRGTRGRPPAKM